jgi:hypothetical protein
MRIKSRGTRRRVRFEEAYGDVLVLSSESHVYTALEFGACLTTP